MGERKKRRYKTEGRRRRYKKTEGRRRREMKEQKEEEGDEGAEGGKKKWEEAETRWLRRGRREGTPGGGMC